ncbi:putative DNA-binding protein [Dyadobacter jejuensis]|uniref:Putative DNA-binding protein n=1 Tax=Dyadobacter jejuensis TaxID=1082580 RepID=A0A316AIH3_9BACT|nr:ATP-binding protein [Dyadobacter jejuensis]PWJ56764.1 putative DNA-binding protein [Dyadobacter jejuensis]
MKQQTTIQLIKSGEGLCIEFKRKIDSVYKIAKTINSFANTSGGVLLIGIGDKGEIVGVPSELNELRKLERIVTQLIDPPMAVRIKSPKIEGKTILRVEIPESDQKPHYLINEKQERIIYVRVKDKSIPIPRLLMAGEVDADTEKLLTTRHVKTLINLLKENDTINPKAFSRVINISEKRAERMLNNLAEKQILLKVSKAGEYSLKWSE